MNDTTTLVVEGAQTLLKELGFDAERSNERSALVLLALIHLTPSASWRDASAPMLRTVDIMNWIRDEFGVSYAPNTRETIRRFTLHQFSDALLVQRNPDSPQRPVNSPRTCYQIHPRALHVIRAFGTPGFVRDLEAYLMEVPGLRAQYEAARKMNRVPVRLPDGSSVTLSPGGQNILIKQILEDFGGFYLHGGQVLYVGDADDKWAVFDERLLARLGVSVDHHGKMPDLVVYLPDKNWLVLMEAAVSHGPVDSKRHSELSEIFGGATAGLVFVSCFPSRAVMRKFLTQIAWETDVWCADNPTHLIHFNGERFLGPYEP